MKSSAAKFADEANYFREIHKCIIVGLMLSMQLSVPLRSIEYDEMIERIDNM